MLFQIALILCECSYYQGSVFVKMMLIVQWNLERDTIQQFDHVNFIIFIVAGCLNPKYISKIH
jgi:hypothetical protein